MPLRRKRKKFLTRPSFWRDVYWAPLEVFFISSRRLNFFHRLNKTPPLTKSDLPDALWPSPHLSLLLCDFNLWPNNLGNSLSSSQISLTLSRVFNTPLSLSHNWTHNLKKFALHPSNNREFLHSRSFSHTRSLPFSSLYLSPTPTHTPGTHSLEFSILKQTHFGAHHTNSHLNNLTIFFVEWPENVSLSLSLTLTHTLALLTKTLTLANTVTARERNGSVGTKSAHFWDPSSA